MTLGVNASEAGKTLPAIISVHDVMPETLAQVEQILAGPLAAFEPPTITLLVVPGRAWQPQTLARLKSLYDRGYEFAGHGWSHRVSRIRGFYHWCHSLLISRRAAEHLSLTGAEIRALLARNAQWFCDHGFEQPALYVPPAWAMGAVSYGELRQTSFEAVETLQGIRSIPHATHQWLPLAGFEADTAWRAWVLSALNRWAISRTCLNRPLRIAIHPMDFQLRLSHALASLLTNVFSVHWRKIL